MTGTAEVPPDRCQSTVAPTGHLILYSLIMLLLVIIGQALLPVPYVKLSPGPMYNVIGASDGVEMIQISGVVTHPTAGELDMVTVTERGGPAGPLTLPEAYWGWFDSTQLVVPEQLIYPPNRSAEESQQLNAAMFSQSESNAVAAALNYLHLPMTEAVVVASVVASGPAAGQLQSDDVLVRVDATAITSSSQAANVIRSHPPGSTVRFTVLRGGQSMQIPVVLAAAPGRPQVGFAGLTLASRFSATFPINFGIKDIGGPSAGTMLALGIIDKLSAESVNGGRLVAGTGTVTPDGNVGAIGGIAQKMAAARKHGSEIFLAPAGNCDDVVAAGTGELNVVKVASVGEAVTVLRQWLAGDANLPRC